MGTLGMEGRCTALISIVPGSCGTRPRWVRALCRHSDLGAGCFAAGRNPCIPKSQKHGVIKDHQDRQVQPQPTPPFPLTATLGATSTLKRAGPQWVKTFRGWMLHCSAPTALGNPCRAHSPLSLWSGMALNLRLHQFPLLLHPVVCNKHRECAQRLLTIV